MIITKISSKFDICQLPKRTQDHFFKFFTNHELADFRKVNTIWNIHIEPYIYHKISNLTFSIFSRCVTPLPFFSLGPMYNNLKLAEILNPKCCFSVCVQTNNRITIQFKILKMAYASNYRLTKSLLPKLTCMFNRLSSVNQNTILEYLDEFTLITQASRVSKAWMLTTQDYSAHWRNLFISLGKGETMSYKDAFLNVKLCGFSRQNYSCMVQIRRIGIFHAKYNLCPPSNMRLVDFYEIKIPGIMLDFEYKEKQWKDRLHREAEKAMKDIREDKCWRVR